MLGSLEVLRLGWDHTCGSDRMRSPRPRGAEHGSSSCEWRGGGSGHDGSVIAEGPDGDRGLDKVTDGGLPRGRPTLVTGSAGCGKTLFGVEFLVHGALDHGEPGVLLAFEESVEDLAANVVSLGFDLHQLEADGLLVVDAFRVDPAEIIETGAYDLDGLFIRLAYAVESIGAKRVVLDTIEVLFGALKNEATIRSELGRLFRWMKDRGLTAVVTGEPGVNQLTRHAIEEYVSDCVIVLDHRVSGELSTRRLRVVKYRGSLHGTNEYPFLITDRGLVVLPITSVGLTYDAPADGSPPAWSAWTTCGGRDLPGFDDADQRGRRHG